METEGDAEFGKFVANVIQGADKSKKVAEEQTGALFTGKNCVISARSFINALDRAKEIHANILNREGFLMTMVMLHDSLVEYSVSGDQTVPTMTLTDFLTDLTNKMEAQIENIYDNFNKAQDPDLLPAYYTVEKPIPDARCDGTEYYDENVADYES